MGGPNQNNSDKNIRNHQPMVRASVTERWAQLKTGNMIVFTHNL